MIVPPIKWGCPVRGPALAKKGASVSVHCSVNEKGAPLKNKTKTT